MPSIDSSTPILTAVNSSGGGYNAPNSATVIAQPHFGMQTIWSGPGGTFEIRPAGNLLSLATLNTVGFPYLLNPGHEFISLEFQGGNGVGIVRSGTDFIISVVPNTTVQQILTQLNGIQVGTGRNTINFIPGTGIGITGVDANGALNYTFSTTSATASGHFVVTQSEPSLTNSFDLGLLSSGLLKQTVTSSVSVPSIAIGNTDYMLVNSNMLDLYDSSAAEGSLFYFTGGHWNAIAPGPVGDVLTVISSTSIGWGSGAPIIDNWSNYPAVTNVNMAGFSINNLHDPVNPQDAATKNYVDTHSGGAPTGASYLIAQQNVSLTSAVNLGVLPTGLVLSTVASNVSTVSTVPESTFAPAPITATVVTTNASPTVLATIAIPTNEALTIIGAVIARNSTNTDCTGGTYSLTVINDAGVISLIGDPFVIVNAASTALFSVSVVGTNVIVSVTGIAATTYNWKTSYNLTSL